MARITVKDVRAAAEAVNTNMRKLGLLSEGMDLILVEPVRGCGDVYRLHTRVVGEEGYGVTGLLPGGSVDGSYLGHTAREALRVLEVVNAGLVTQYNREQMRTLSALKTPKFVGSASGQKQEDGQ
jgi:hypothetical protein